MGTVFRGVVDVIDRQRWLDPVSDRLQHLVATAFTRGGPAGRRIQNFLYGTWLGHPLHPALTDVPLGAWTAALTLDALEALSARKELAPGADTAIAIGLVGATGAAITGLNDWQHTDNRARRIGLVHGLLNASAVLLYTGSLILRLQGSRSSGRRFALAGFAVANFAAYLGGELPYGEHIGVNHAVGAQPPPNFVPVMAEAELPEGEPRRIEIGGARVLLVRHGAKIHALGEVCSHLGGPLAEGEFRNDTVTCPWHLSRFSLEDGQVLDGPATFPQPHFEARVREGQIEVRAPR